MIVKQTKKRWFGGA